MGATVKTLKMEQAYNCLLNFKDNSSNEDFKKFVDLLFQMIFNKNTNRLEISVGKIPEHDPSHKRGSNVVFYPVMSMVTHNFNVCLSNYGNEPELVFNDMAKHCTITAINLAKINELRIEKEIDESINWYRYDIFFNYNNEIDYHIGILINE